MTETLDNSHPDPRIGVIVDATSTSRRPPPPTRTAGRRPPGLLRLVNARGGRVAKNRLKGGPVELCDGPWEIVENDFQGTVPGTVSPNVIAAHSSYDLVVQGQPGRGRSGPSGKTWRFLVLTGSGANDRIEENVVVGIGPRDDDTIPPANAPEVVLTEAYHLHFEGKPAAISADGSIVSLGQGQPLGPPVQVGSVVAVARGRAARPVAADRPGARPRDLPARRAAPRRGPTGSRSRPGSSTRPSRGTRSTRGAGRRPPTSILAGNHFGTRVLDNHLLGAGDAFQITAFPSESPGIWGWSHAPFLGGLIAGNTIEDAERGGTARRPCTRSTPSRTAAGPT